MIIKFYNIHNIVKFKIIINTNQFHKKISNLEIEYKNFECKKIEESDFTVYIGEFYPNINNCYIVDENYYIKENYLYCKQDSYKLAKWKFELAGFEGGEITLKISSNFIGEIFIAQFIINFIIQLKLTEKGYPIVHASCIDKDDKGYLFSARGGGGKTTTALKLLEHGFNFLGDNFTIIHSGGALGFLSPLNIFTYNLTKDIRNKLTLKEKSLFKIKSILYRLTLGYAKIFTQINPIHIYPNSIINQSKLNKIFYLIQKNSLHIQPLKRDEFIKHLIFNQQMEFTYFTKYIIEYSSVFPQSSLALFWKNYKSQLERQIPLNIPIYKLEIPQVLDDGYFGKIQEMISIERNSEL